MTLAPRGPVTFAASPSMAASAGPMILPGGTVRFRVWAPDHARVSVVVDGHTHALTREGQGMHVGEAPGGAGSRYGFRLGDPPRVLPDPASPYQPDGTDALSEVVDHAAFPWTDGAWRGHPAEAHVLYELHCGTFTPEGTWQAARRELAALAALGITTLQLMPVHTFAGTHGWGYDSVFWYAPHPAYGRPDDLRVFVDEAHRLGLAVILDVVYNHVGPRGCVLQEYGQAWFAGARDSEWGAGLNFDGPDAEPVRRFVIDNAAYWIREFHLDGLRLDATQSIHDTSPVHIVAALTAAARAAAPHRHVLIVAENEPQETRLLDSSEAGGFGIDVLYNDDFHHAVRTRLTGWRDAYYSDYTGTARELEACLRFGFLYQGQYYAWQDQRRGTPSVGVPPTRFLCCLENHDQVANSDPAGRRLHRLAAPAQWRACVALLLLGPWLPLVFQGQEFASRAPWLYFADHPGDLGAQVRDGRAAFMRQFRRLRSDRVLTSVRDPLAPETVDACRLRRPPDETDGTDEDGAAARRLHADLLAWRRILHGAATRLEASAPTDDLLLVHVWHPSTDYLLAVNLGTDVDLARLSDPLVAPGSRDRTWQLAWSSDAIDYGGAGAPGPEPESSHWWAPGHAATLLQSTRADHGDEA